ncbi:MAG: hypothetical protein H5U26_00595 [Immundisolibacter sp.]|uniref:EF-hand domain-containing protein n=1 Tax=Immundisolibacter sp. TaxID=1934948 RepID=UPI0019A105F1|nr:hypothetical protein [Immundisolibacter sp.]MBC7160593.1 hypothetical protein [Immundisolibacter sp.]
MRIAATSALALALAAAGTAAGAQPSNAPTAQQQQALQARWQAADADHDGFIDRTEAQALPPIAKRFDELDANGDGKLTAEETRKSAQDRLRAADANQDGFIDRAEAEASLPRVAKAFDRLDGNADGKLSVEEVQQVASRFGGRLRR